MRNWQIQATISRVDNAAAAYELSIDRQPVTIGASVDNDIVLEGTGISNQHAQVTMSRGMLSIQNLSRNGSFVGDERIERRSLQPGDVVRIPPYELRFELIISSDEATTDESAPNLLAPVAGTVILPARTRRKEGLSLKITDGPQAIKGKRFEIPDRGIRIGRSPDADLCIDIPTLSRFHAEIRTDSHGEWRLRDLNSSNGTYLNGTRITENRVRVGDELTLADDVVLRIIDDSTMNEPRGAASSPRQQPPNRPLEPTPALIANAPGPRPMPEFPDGPTMLRRPAGGTPSDTANRKPAHFATPASAHTLAIHSRRADWNTKVLILQVEGRVDSYNYTELSLALDRVVDAGERGVMVNLSSVAYIDHIGLGVLLKAITAVERYGGRICLIGANQRLMDSISLSRLDSTLKGKLFPDEPAAQKEFAKRP